MAQSARPLGCDDPGGPSQPCHPHVRYPLPITATPMPLLRFIDFEAYSDAFVGVDGIMRVIGPGKEEWALDMLDAGEVVVSVGNDGAPALYNGLNHADRYLAYVSLPGSDAALQGQDTCDEQFIWFPPSAEIHGRTRKISRFLGISMDAGAVVQRAREVAGSNINAANLVFFNSIYCLCRVENCSYFF